MYIVRVLSTAKKILTSGRALYAIIDMIIVTDTLSKNRESGMLNSLTQAFEKKLEKVKVRSLWCQ